MTKLNLDLINQFGNGEFVPKELDRHIVKYVIGNRKRSIEVNHTLIQSEPWDHSDVFYTARTWLNQHGWDTSVYNDNVAGGYDRRKNLYDAIKEVCEITYGVKRHQIGIFPEDRAIMAYNGRMYAVGFENLRNLMGLGTDVIVVEKAGTVMKMVPFTEKIGVAFIQSQGFVSEYGIALAGLCNRQEDVAINYTGYVDEKDGKRYFVCPLYTGHLGVLTDCDHSGVVIGAKIAGATRLGIDLNTIREINEANPGLDLEINDIQEGTKPNSHWEGLYNLVHPRFNSSGTRMKKKGGFVENLSVWDKMHYREYLHQKMIDGDGNEIRFLDYVKTNRIELNTIMSEIKPEAFFNWLRYKILKVWPRRDYRRAITLPEYLYTDTMTKFNEWYQEQSKPIIKDAVSTARDELSDVEGFIENVDDKQEEIEDDIIENTLTPNDKMQKIDLALNAIMKDEVSTA